MNKKKWMSAALVGGLVAHEVRRVRERRHSLLLAGFLLVASSGASAIDPGSCVISDAGIGPVRLGMTLREAKRAFPHAALTRTSDAEGVAFVSVVAGKDELMTLYANEDDADKPIDWSKKIASIETFHPGCVTAGGVHPGMPVRQAEKKLGKVARIVQSEIESREYLYFSRQPGNLIFRLDYTGIFPEGRHETEKFSAGAKILSITVQSR